MIRLFAAAAAVDASSTDVELTGTSVRFRTLAPQCGLLLERSVVRDCFAWTRLSS